MQTATIDAPRTQLVFCVHGLPVRDELVLKSLVRLLDHRTHQHWICSSENPDLDLVGNDVDSAATDLDTVCAAKEVVRVGRSKVHAGLFLSLPVNSSALEVLLNDLGRRISEAKRCLAALPDSSESTSEFRLLKWPPVALLSDPARLKIATMIMGRSLSASVLAQQASISMQECASYLQALRVAGCLVLNTVGRSDHEVDVGTVTPVKEKVVAGLLARIRSRLGLTR